MIFILLLYVLPLVISTILMYCVVKLDKGTMGDFLENVPYLLIPILNVVVILTFTLDICENWLKNDESWNNFKNKKL